MKSNKLNKFVWLFIAMLSTLFFSCNDDEATSTNPPVIEKVSAAVDASGNPTNLDPTNVGFANNTYVVQGSGFKTLKKIYFNDFEAAFNPNLVTDTTIFVTIPLATPYLNQSNKLKIITENGTAEYDFTVAAPAPLVESYNPINALEGQTITIFGSYFINPVVTIGDTEATIVSSSFNEIQVVVPANSQFETISVTTISGTGVLSQPIGTAIYDDAAAPFVENYLGPWDGSGYLVNTAEKMQGLSSIEATFTGYTGFKFPMFATPPSTSSYSGIRVSFKSTKATGKFKIVVNGNYGAGKEVTFNNLGWTTYSIPFSDLGGNPGTLSELVFQEFNNDGGDKLYIDDVGFVLN